MRTSYTNTYWNLTSYTHSHSHTQPSTPLRWVWATPHAKALAVEGVRVTRVLGCVTCLKPWARQTPGDESASLPSVILFNAWNGDKMVRLQSEVVAVGFEAEEVLNQQNDFKRFIACFLAILLGFTFI